MARKKTPYQKKCIKCMIEFVHYRFSHNSVCPHCKRLEFRTRWRNKYREQNKKYFKEVVYERRKKDFIYQLNNRKYGKKSWDKVHKPLIEFLGGKCAYCNSDEKLEIDHINAGGNAETKKFNGKYNLYKYYNTHIDEAKQKLQILCEKCNMKKETINKERWHNIIKNMGGDINANKKR